MRVHVAVTGEPNQEYANMIALLLYSLRQNGGMLSDAPVTVAINAAEMPVARRREIERLGDVTCRIMPRQHGGADMTNKFNALYAPLDEYDVLLFLDADTVVFKPLDDLVSGMNPEKAQFRARAIGALGAQSAGAVEPLLRKYVLSDGQSLKDITDARFHPGYPLFNSGVMVMTQPAVRHVRQEGAKLAYALYSRRARTSQASAIEMLREAGRRVRSRLFENASQSTYDFWMTEQLGIAFSVIAGGIDYDVLSPYFNWVHTHRPPESELPAIFHYMSGRHPQINRECLFDGAWVESYLSTESPPRQALARLAQEYASVRESQA